MKQTFLTSLICIFFSLASDVTAQVNPAQGIYVGEWRFGSFRHGHWAAFVPEEGSLGQAPALTFAFESTGGRIYGRVTEQVLTGADAEAPVPDDADIYFTLPGGNTPGEDETHFWARLREARTTTIDGGGGGFFRNDPDDYRGYVFLTGERVSTEGSYRDLAGIYKGSWKDPAGTGPLYFILFADGRFLWASCWDNGDVVDFGEGRLNSDLNFVTASFWGASYVGDVVIDHIDGTASIDYAFGAGQAEKIHDFPYATVLGADFFEPGINGYDWYESAYGLLYSYYANIGWSYHPTHGWVWAEFVDGGSTDEAWVYSLRLAEWFFLGADIAPYVYSPEDGWGFFDERSGLIYMFEESRWR